MTLQDLQQFLMGHGTGIVAAQLQKTAEVAAEAGYKGVWGAYPWSVRRATTSLVTVANQAFTNLPTDFESALPPRSTSIGYRYTINIMDEPSFDESFPDPTVMTGVPTHCKIVYENPVNKFRAVWYPVPASAYTLPFAYNRQADLANLPNLPGWLVHAIVQKCLVLMEKSVEGQLQRNMLANQALSEAMSADSPITGIGPTFGADPGWDDFSGTPSQGEWLKLP